MRSRAGMAAAVVAALITACSGVDRISTPVTTSEGSGAGAMPDDTDRSGSAASSRPGAAATTEPETDTPTAAEAGEPIERGLPDSAEALATDLTDAERTIRDPDATDAVAFAAGRRLQLLYSHLGRNPDWAPTVLQLVGDDIAPDVADHWEARRALSSLVTSGPLATSLPAWKIVEPLPPAELTALYKEAEAATGIQWPYLAAINLVETRMGRIVDYSTAGAVGPMQFLPSTWAECCDGDPTVPADAIHGAAVYLTHRGGPDDMTRALRGYNNSDHYVVAVSAYARIIERNPLAYRGLWAFEVYFRTATGVVHLPVGYDEPEPVPVEQWVAAHPGELTAD